MKASVILVTYNGLRYLPDCLHHLALQLGEDCEVILIDNASTDGSADYIQEHHPQVSLVRNPSNTGFAAGCNQGAALACGEFLVFLNQDTCVCPGWLQGLLETLTSDGSVGLATSKVLLMSRPEHINMCGQDVHYSGLVFARGFLQPAAEYRRAETVSAIFGASFAIRRQLWIRLGGFDELYFMYYEETDLCWRAWLAGYASLYAPPSRVYHDYGLKPSPNSLYYSARNRWLLLLKHWRLPTLLLLAPGLLLAELVEWGLVLRYGWQGLSAKFRAAGWLVKNMPALLSRRRVNDPTRIKPDWFLLEHCAPVIKPTLVTGGLAGKILLLPLNCCFWLNYHFARGVVRFLNI